MEVFTIEGVDVERGIAYSGAGNADYYFAVLETFCNEITEKLVLLEKCVAEEDFPCYTIHVHAIKSVCASIGANDVSQDAMALETATRSGDFDFIKDCHSEFARNATKLVNDIQKALDGRPVAAVHSNLDENDMIAKLEALKVALEEYDVALIDQLSNDLQIYESHTTQGGSIKEILHNAFITNYDKATQLIDKMT